MPEAQADDLKDGFFIPGVDANKENAADQNVKVPFATLQAKMGGGSSSGSDIIVSPLVPPIMTAPRSFFSSSNTAYSLSEGVQINWNYNPTGYPMPVIKGFNFYSKFRSSDESIKPTQIQYQIWSTGAKLVEGQTDVPFGTADFNPFYCSITFDQPLSVDSFSENHEWNPGQPLVLILGPADFPEGTTPDNSNCFELVPNLYNSVALGVAGDSAQFYMDDSGLMSDPRFRRGNSILSFQNRIQEVTTNQPTTNVLSCTPWIQFVIEG